MGQRMWKEEEEEDQDKQAGRKTYKQAERHSDKQAGPQTEAEANDETIREETVHIQKKNLPGTLPLAE